jgi:hypothetical protein
MSKLNINELNKLIEPIVHHSLNWHHNTYSWMMKKYFGDILGDDIRIYSPSSYGFGEANYVAIFVKDGDRYLEYVTSVKDNELFEKDVFESSEQKKHATRLYDLIMKLYDIQLVEIDF